MRSLLELISQHSDANSIIPLIAIAAVITIIVIYSFVKVKWVKYLLSVVVLIVGSVIFYRGYKTMLQPIGLDLMITGTKVLVFGIVAFTFSLIMDILDSLAKVFKNDMNKKKEKSKKNINENKAQETKIIKIDDEETKILTNLINDDTTVLSGKSIADETTVIPDSGLIGDATAILSGKDIIDDNTKIINDSDIDDDTKRLFS